MSYYDCAGNEYATKEDRLAAEQKAGRRLAIKHQAEALIKDIMWRYNFHHGLEFCMNGSDEPTDWTVTFHGNDMPVVDNWVDFPSEEFRATLMLLGAIK